MKQRNGRVRGALIAFGIVFGLSFPFPGHPDDIGVDNDRRSVDVEILSSMSEGYADASVCMACHDENSKFPVLAILATRHAVKADPRSPLASEHGCQACHGPSAAHVASGIGDPPPAVVFGVDEPAGPQNEVCLSCHMGGKRMGWAGSQHDKVNLSCASCHTIHTQEDPVLVKNIDPMNFAREGQASVCFECHKNQRAQIQNRVSSHPLREGKVDCSDCHDPHGSIGPKNLAKPTLNETCFQCHADKRGPFLWEHAPVREDCSICHQPHGSNNPVLLKTRMPQLCQQCHMASRHPSTPYGGPEGSPLVADRRVGMQSCLNCHSQIHGSNHPSGVRWVR